MGWLSRWRARRAAARDFQRRLELEVEDAYREGGVAQREVENAARDFWKPQRDMYRFTTLYLVLLFVVLVPLIVFFALIKALVDG